MREVSPWRLYSDFKGDQTTYRLLNTYGHGKELRLRILRSLLRRFIDRSNEYQPSDWPRTSTRVLNADNWYRLESTNYLPIEEPDAVTNFEIFSNQGAGDAIEADALYRLIPLLHEIALEPSIVQDLAAWCGEVWPLGDWQMRATDSDGDRLHDYWEGIRFNTLAYGTDDDPDGNGFSNLSDYITGNQLLGYQTEPVLSSNMTSSEIQLGYFRPVYLDGLTFQLERSQDLSSWNPATGSSTSSSIANEVYVWVVETHDASGEKNFYRLTVDSSQE